MSYMNYLEGYFDMSVEHPPNLSHKAASNSDLSGVNMTIPGDIINGVGGGKGIALNTGDENYLEAYDSSHFDVGDEDFSMLILLARMSASTDDNFIIYKGAGDFEAGYQLRIDSDNKVAVVIQDYLFADAEMLGSVLPMGVFTCITMTHSTDGRSRLYENEALVDEDFTFLASLSNNITLAFGAEGTGKGANFSDVLIDTTMFFRCELTQTQVIDLCHCTKQGSL